MQTGGLANGGLARKGPIGPKRALSGKTFRSSLVAVGVQRNWSRSAPKRPRPALKWRQFARPKGPIFQEGFPPDFLRIWGLSPKFVSPPLDFPKTSSRKAGFQGVSEYGFMYGSKRWKSESSVDSQLRTQLTKQPPQSSSQGSFTCSFCHLDFVKELPRFGRKPRLKSAKKRKNSTQVRLKSTKSPLKSTKWGLLISHLRWCERTSKGNLFVRVRFRVVPGTVEEVVWVRFCCLWVERSTRETRAEQYSGRIKHAPNRGHHSVSPSPPFSLRGIGPFRKFPVPENTPFLWEVLLFVQDLLYESTVSPGNWGQKVTRNLSTPKLQRFLRLRCPSRTPEIAAISETRESNAALRF